MESSPPESGFRIEVARSVDAEGPPWHYTGRAHTPSTTYHVSAIVNADGTVRVELAVAGEGAHDDGAATAPPRLARGVATVVKAACAKVEIDSAVHPPHKIVRWHAER